MADFSNDAVKFRKFYAPHSPYLEEWQARIIGDPPHPKNNPKNLVWILVTAILTMI
jgi:hypothetical protein